MHPLDTFKYCPKCGSSHFVENDDKSKLCKDCRFTYYFNSSAAVATFIINKKGELLVARRAKEPAKGTLDLPGGFIDLYETAEEAVIREVKEETGITINKIQYLFSLPNIYLYSEFDVHTVDLFFQCTVEDSVNFNPDDDVSELFFLSRDKINPDLFGLGSIKKAIQIWINK